MGGQNHQPCNRIMTAASAWLSQRVGSGFLNVLKANNHLEDAIMIGMDRIHIEDLAGDVGGTVIQHLDLTISALGSSLADLKAIPTGFERLREIAYSIGYKGSPFAGQLKEFGLSEKFKGTLICPAINEAAWKDLQDMICKKNIMGTLAWESEQFHELTGETETLIKVIEESKEIAASSGAEAFVNAVENNGVPMRQHYARVFSRWNYLHAMFLYSALIMTELYYKLNELPSLLSSEASSDRGYRAA